MNALKYFRCFLLLFTAGYRNVLVSASAASDSDVVAEISPTIKNKQVAGVKDENVLDVKEVPPEENIPQEEEQVDERVEKEPDEPRKVLVVPS